MKYTHSVMAMQLVNNLSYKCNYICFPSGEVIKVSIYGPENLRQQ